MKLNETPAHDPNLSNQCDGKISRVSRPLMPMRGLALFRLGWTAFIVLATSVPYLVAWFSTPAGYHYTWIIPPYPEDSFSYMAWSRQAIHGAWLFRIKYTALSNPSFLFNPFFLMCGWISAASSLNIGIVFLLVKAVGVIWFLTIFYKYIDYLGFGQIESVAASLLVGISSGFGGMFVLFGLTGIGSTASADLWMPEVSTFWALLSNPLFPFSLTLLLLSIYWLDRGTRCGRASNLWLSGLSAGVMSLIHPYSQPLLISFAAILIIVRTKGDALNWFCHYFTTLAPFLFYCIFVTISNPIVASHGNLGKMASPSLLRYILGLGFPLMLSIGGAVALRRRWFHAYWQFALWFCLSVALAYGPFWFQRKLVFGVHIPLCILGGVFIGWIAKEHSSKPGGRWLAAAAAVIFVPVVAATTILQLIEEQTVIRQNKDGCYFVSDDVMKGLEFLRTKTDPETIVFAGVPTSRLIPGFSGNTVVWGHWAQSVDLKERVTWFSTLFNKDNDWNDKGRLNAFWGSNIQYFFADGDFKRDLEKHPFHWRVILTGAKIMFANPSVVIYQRPNNVDG